MIKSLFEEDKKNEKQEKSRPKKGGGPELVDETSPDITEKENIKTPDDVKTENRMVETPDDKIETIEEIKTAIEAKNFPPPETEKVEPPGQSNFDTVKPFEIDKPIGQPVSKRKTEDNQLENEVKNEPPVEKTTNSSRATELEQKLRELEEELRIERDSETKKLEKKSADIQIVEPLDETETIVALNRQEQPSLWNDSDKFRDANQSNEDQTIQIKPKDYTPESRADTFRQTGMAWSAAIALFGSVVFMLILGWGADLLLGTTPWGIVVGILIGSVIGFLQFFRTTSQILKPNDFEKVSLASNIKIAENTKLDEISVEQDQAGVEENTEAINELKTNENTEAINELKTIENTEAINAEKESPTVESESNQNIVEIKEEIIELEIEKPDE